MKQTRGPITGDASSDIEQTVVLLQRVVRNLVSNPDAIEIGIRVDADATRLKLRLADQDRERILASQRTLASLQCIVAAMGQRSGLHFALEFQGADDLADK